jgi:hypothetical protein
MKNIEINVPQSREILQSGRKILYKKQGSVIAQIPQPDLSGALFLYFFQSRNFGRH